MVNFYTRLTSLAFAGAAEKGLRAVPARAALEKPNLVHSSEETVPND